MKKDNQQLRRAGYRIRDRVVTIRGEGVIKHIFPRGPHGKITYSVALGNTRFGVIFDEDEIAPISRSVSILLA